MGLDLLELQMRIEDEFGIQIPDEDAARLGTPGAVADYLHAHLPSKESRLNSSKISAQTAKGNKDNFYREQRDEILNRIIALTSEQLGIPQEKILENSHFVKDLGAG